MAFNAGNLTAYLDQLSQKLMHKALLQGTTNKYISKIPNVFNSVSMNLIDESSPFSVQADNQANIGFNDSGSATTTQVNIQVCPLKFQQQYSIYTQGGIETYYLNYLYDAPNLKGSYHDQIPLFEEVWTDMLVKYIDQAVDTAEWIGGYNPIGSIVGPYSANTSGAHSADTGASSASYLGTCQGFLYQIWNTSASASTVNVAYSGVPNSANIINIVNTMVAAIPVNILDQPLIIFTSPATVQAYKLAIVNSNAYNYYVSDAKPVLAGGDGSAAENSLTQAVPGQNILMVGTYGLQGYGGLVLSYAKNFHFATALESDYTTIKSWYSMDFDVFRCMSRWRQGAAIAWPQYVVSY